MNPIDLLRIVQDRQIQMRRDAAVRTLARSARSHRDDGDHHIERRSRE